MRKNKLTYGEKKIMKKIKQENDNELEQFLDRFDLENNYMSDENEAKSPKLKTEIDWQQYFKFVEQIILYRAKMQNWIYKKIKYKTYRSENETEYVLGVMSLIFYFNKKE